MRKSDRLYKLSQGTETAIWACDEILRQDERITELEKEHDDYKAKVLNALPAYDLRQQAKGIEDLGESALFRGYLENTISRDDCIDLAADLRKQADELEQSE